MNTIIKPFNIQHILGCESESDLKNNTQYHYTSPYAAKAIIESHRIRFTDINYLNDKTEGIYFIKTVLKIVHDNPEKYQCINQLMNILLSDSEQERLTNNEIFKVNYNEIPNLPIAKERHFVFCTSKKKDDLNMWNYYIGTDNKYQGYSLGIQVHEVMKNLSGNENEGINPFLIYYGEIIYDTNKQKQIIEKWLNEKEVEYQRDRRKNSAEWENRDAVDLRLLIEQKKLFFKDKSFKNEREYRILISIVEERIVKNKKNSYIPENGTVKLYQDFDIKNGIIIPFIDVVFPEKALNSVCIAPLMETEIAKAGMEELLRSSGYNNCTVTSSKIPVRF